MWAQEYNHGMPLLVQIQIAYALATAYDGYILGVHMDGRTLRHNVMQNPAHVHIIFVVWTHTTLLSRIVLFIFHVYLSNVWSISWICTLLP